MFCLNPPKPLSLLHTQLQSSPFLHFYPLLNITKPPLKPISASATPSPPSSSSSPNQQLYQPFRPPPSPLPSQFSSLETDGRIEILANRLGLWFEYAPLITSLFQEGFTPSSLEEATGISGVEQNRFVVGAKVRESLVQSKLDPETLAFFDSGGAEILYEIRLLNASQRAAAARYAVANRLDGRATQELARAMKDFPRRRGDPGWEGFSYSIPADCLSFMYFRQSREFKNPSENRTLALRRALDVAGTEKAKRTILDELEEKPNRGDSDEMGIGVSVKVPVVRLKIGEVSEATKIVVLPVCRAEGGEREVEQAPGECKSTGEFGVIVSEKEWKRWVVLPGWKPLMGTEKGLVVVSFVDARVLPWKVNRWYNEEKILIVADKRSKEVVAEDGFYLVSVESGGLKVERGSRLKEMGVKNCLGSVVLVVRPPKDEIEDQLEDDDWE